MLEAGSQVLIASGEDPFSSQAVAIGALGRQPCGSNRGALYRFLPSIVVDELHAVQHDIPVGHSGTDRVFARVLNSTTHGFSLTVCTMVRRSDKFPLYANSAKGMLKLLANCEPLAEIATKRRVQTS